MSGSFSEKGQSEPLRGSSETSLFEMALDCLPDGVLLVRHGTTIVYANRAFEQIWNVPHAIVAAKDDAALLPLVAGQVLDTESFIGEVKRLYRSPESSEDTVVLKDGRIISRRSVPFGDDGDLNTRIWIFTDVTEIKQAQVDPVTGLPNRRAYAKQYPASVLAQSDGLFRSVAIMDIDNFKSYNDTYGHAAGDEVLRRVGHILRVSLTKSDDLVFRIGGEEFLIASRFRKRAAIATFFEGIRNMIQSEKIDHSGNDPYGCVTASFGISVFTGPEEPDVVFRNADSSLYRAKALGKNRLIFDAA